MLWFIRSTEFRELKIFLIVTFFSQGGLGASWGVGCDRDPGDFEILERGGFGVGCGADFWRA